MAYLGRGWNRLWFAPFDPVPAALFRISLGLLLTLMYLALFPNWARYFGVDGVTSLNDPTVAEADDRWSLFYLMAGVPLTFFWALGVVAGLGFTLGWRTRVWTVVLYLLEVSMIHRNRFAINGEDLVARMVLFYACFAPLGASLSLDARRARRRALAGAGVGKVSASIWPVRLIQIGVALIYVTVVGPRTDSSTPRESVDRRRHAQALMTRGSESACRSSSHHLDIMWTSSPTDPALP